MALGPAQSAQGLYKAPLGSLVIPILQRSPSLPSLLTHRDLHGQLKETEADVIPKVFFRPCYCP